MFSLRSSNTLAQWRCFIAETPRAAIRGIMVFTSLTSSVRASRTLSLAPLGILVVLILILALLYLAIFFYSLFSVLLSEEAFVPLFAVLLELASVVPQLVAELVSLLEFLEFVKLERLIHSEDGLVAAESLDSVKRDLEFLGDLRKFKKSVVLMSSGALETVTADQILE